MSASIEEESEGPPTCSQVVVTVFLLNEEYIGNLLSATQTAGSTWAQETISSVTSDRDWGNNTWKTLHFLPLCLLHPRKNLHISLK